MADENREQTIATLGFKVVGEKEAKISDELLTEYDAARKERYEDMVENDRFYHGKHYDDAEETEILARGQAPIPINVTYSLIKQMIALITSADPIWYVDPITDADKDIAYMMRGLLVGTWYHSRGSRQYSHIVKDTAVTGHGFGMVNPSNIGSQFLVKFTHVPYHHVYVSPSVREFDYGDSENWIIAKTLSFQQIANFFKKPVEWVEKIANASNAVVEDDPEIKYPRYVSAQKGGRRAKLIQRMTMETATVYKIMPAGPDELTERVVFSLTEEMKKKAARGIVRIKELKGQKVVAKYISFGDYCEKYLMPLSNYPIIPFIDEFNGNPYPLGEVDFLYGLQRALNKFVLLSILNATLSNNMKVMAPENSIDPDRFEQSYAMPAALITYEWREGMPQPQQINPVPLSSDFYSMPKTLISMMEYVVGIFGVVQGNPEGAPRTASGLMSLQNYGGQKVKLLARNIQEALAALGDRCVELYQNYAPYNQQMTYYEENTSNPTQVNYNQLRSEGGKLKVDNNISQGTFRTRVRVVQNYGSEREMKAMLLTNLAQTTGATQLLKPILKLADIPEIDEILNDIDQVEQAKGQIQQLSEKVKRLEEVNKQLENEVMRKSRQVEVTQFAAELDKIINKISANASADVKLALGELQQQIQNAQMQAQQAVSQMGSEEAGEVED